MDFNFLKKIYTNLLEAALSDNKLVNCNDGRTCTRV